MKRSNILGYLCLGITLFILLSIPPKKMHRLRASLVGKVLQTQKSRNQDKLAIQIKLLKEENSTLKQLLNAPLTPANNPLIAKVIFRDPAFWASSVLIDKGRQNRHFIIEKNSPVLSNGYLIGIVEEVFETFSKIRLITDKHIQLSIKTEKEASGNTLNVGTLGGSALIDKRTCFRHVTGLFFSRELRVGDKLLTSGLDKIFPEGIPVAEVTEVTFEPEEVAYPFKAIVLAPDIKDLKYVSVLKPLIEININH